MKYIFYIFLGLWTINSPRFFLFFPAIKILREKNKNKKLFIFYSKESILNLIYLIMSTGKRMRSGPQKGPKFGKKMRTTMPSQKRIALSKETGYVDLAFASYALDTTGSIILIPTIAQGTAVTQRVGKKVMLKSLQCRGYMLNNAAATYNDVAFLIVYDKRPTGALPAITDILVGINASSMNNDNNSGRFQVLKRVDADLTGIPATSNGTGPGMSVDFYLPIKGKQIVYKAAATGAIADIEEGALYLVTVGIQAAGTTAAALNVGFRTRFVDF